MINGTWQLDYTLTLNLNIGQNYTVNGPGGATYTAATDGLRDITGEVNGDGTVSIFAITSTVSSATDEGTDPNKLVSITDALAFTSANQASNESFTTLETAAYGQVLRGVSFAPVPEPSTWILVIVGIGLVLLRVCGVPNVFLQRQ